MTVVVTYQNLPKKTNSLAVANGDGSFTIIVNRSLDDQERKKAVAGSRRQNKVLKRSGKLADIRTPSWPR